MPKTPSAPYYSTAFLQLRGRLDLLKRVKGESVKSKRPSADGLFDSVVCLQSVLDFKTPSLKQRLRNILGVLVPASPLAQANRALILVRGQLKLFYVLLERGYDADDRVNRLRLTPVRICATLCRNFCIPP